MAQHACASEGWGPPESNAEAMREPGRHGVVPTDLAETMARGVGLRNVQVHGYAEVEDDVVVAHLDDARELQRLVAEIARWLDQP